MDPLQISDTRLGLAARAATQAGNRAKAVKHTTAQEVKANNTVVTEADREAETIVRETLQADTNHPVLGEEYGGDLADADTYWVVDPIDGTWNFASEQPLYGTAVGLVEDGSPELGVWYMPELDYLFYAVAGHGAYRGPKRIQVTDASDISKSYPVISGMGREQIYPTITAKTGGAQQFGCAVMAEAWVATGWCDVGVFGALAPWDMIVGAVLVREAGGVMKSVTDGSSSWDAISTGRVVFGNETLVDATLDKLSESDRQTIEQTDYDW